MESFQAPVCSAFVYYLRTNAFLRNVDNIAVDVYASSVDDYEGEDDCVPCSLYCLCEHYLLLAAVGSNQ